MAAFAAVDEDPFNATVSAVTAYTVAAELAAKQASGPGSFVVSFLDALAALEESDLAEQAVLS
ncbi:hydroxyethylthiazole kinase [Streptomyces sp. NPDC097727]|uniref:hydroxyethylthiazole kinase n=1 Tax=Streptomyces sp. NPDC097727 TaxID=3366092 RepID=UPI00381E3525